MKTVLTTMLIVFACSCSTPGKPLSKAPTAPASQDTAWPTCPHRPDCTHDNGTQSTGLAEGEQAGTIRAVTLTSGEIITVR
jgi:hypothetical protein